MIVTPKQLYKSNPTAGLPTYATLYTVPASTITIITTIEITVTVAHLLYLHIVPVSSTATTSNSIFYQKGFAVGTTSLRSRLVLNAGETIQFKSAPGATTIAIYGVELS